MGLFDKLFNDDEKEKQEAARRAAAEKYAEEHNRSHAEAASREHAPAKKTAEKASAEKAAARPAAKKAPAAKKTTAASRASVPHQAAPHTHTPEAPNHTHAASSAAAATAAHDQAMTLHVLSHIPDHAPREDDPHYHLFEQAKARLKRQGLWRCMINDDLCDGVPELHHSYIEFSQINQVDPKKVEQALGLHFENDEDFQEWAESPGNLEVLCVAHHRAHYGIHMIPGPLWEALRFHKKGTMAAAEFVPASEAGD
ncbi:hypothetical protein KGA66_16165 [Actinocrinis puniceicyclus]|uniref:Uncharacterized protein n=1 Tax=Actinocrinis puniceicyclus TaxID=977794 RepID=A0A8J7WRD2_9ACTN|nr:hypothetical protein [Actinocrinis puniceicyclus]MBS2964592.1 hypothetical protein [Actinocrinis puniceicyclus]